MFTVYFAGEHGTFQLLILSQVILSMQLPFAVIPLIRFTGDRARMGEFANAPWVRALAWGAAALILVLNFWLVGGAVGPWMMAQPWRLAIGIPPVIGLTILLIWISFVSLRGGVAQDTPEAAAVIDRLPAPVYRRILVPLDHSSRDRAAVAHAAAMARVHGATLHLLHVEEGVTSQLYGELSSTAEVHAGEEYFSGIVRSLAAEGLAADLTVVHGRDPKEEIVRVARELQPDLIVMGAHGHRGVKDLIFGNTINGVRHDVSSPVLVVGDPPTG